MSEPTSSGRAAVTSTAITVLLAALLMIATTEEAVVQPQPDATTPPTAQHAPPLRLETVRLPPPPALPPTARPTPASPPFEITEAPKPRVQSAPKVEIPEPEPGPVPESVPKAKAVTVAATTVDGREGRILLRQMEVGSGPSVEIAWPDKAFDRDTLHQKFSSCYGMVIAILSNDGQLYRASDPSGIPWDLNPDRYSGFVREASGQQVTAEARILATIRQQHGLGQGTAVRLFPRNVDALMLGGLHRLIGTFLNDGGTVQARYRLNGEIVTITDITVNGVAKLGSVQVPARC